MPSVSKVILMSIFICPDHGFAPSGTIPSILAELCDISDALKWIVSPLETLITAGSKII